MRTLLAFFALLVCVFGQSCQDWCNALYQPGFINSCGLTSGNGAAFSDGTTAGCMQFCGQANIPSGSSSDTSGNTLGCRINAANMAASVGTYSANCDVATTQSTGQCGSLCTNYCNTMMNICTGMYPDMNTCMTACATFPTTVSPGRIVNSNLQQNWQDNVACRTYHGSLPSTIASNVHCAHAYITGGGACPITDSPCDSYCRLMLAACPNNLEVAGDSLATCSVRCKVNSGIFGPIKLKNQFNFTGDAALKTGCTNDCRVYHILNAIANNAASTHCPHAWIHAPEGTPCYCSSLALIPAFTNPDSSNTGMVTVTFGTILLAILSKFL